MAYISAENVKAIRLNLKKEFGKKIKFSVRKTSGGLSVDVDILASSIPEFTELMEAEAADELSVNHFYIKDHYADRPVVRDTLSRVYEIIRNAEGGKQWFDKSDSQSDYFHCAFYVHMGIGQWDKPYVNLV